MGSFTPLWIAAYNHDTLYNTHLKTELKHHQKMLQHYTIFKTKQISVLIGMNYTAENYFKHS